MKKHGIKHFLAGSIVTLLVMSMATPSLAALVSKTIEVYTGVNIYIDDVKLEPKDVNGNPVEVFVYNGTTYLPVRAVSEALGKTVQWEGQTSSVFVGKHTGDKPAVWLDSMDYYMGDSILHVDSRTDNLNNRHDRSIWNSFDNTYLLNGQYSAISGILFQLYDARSSKAGGSIRIYGDGDLLYTANVSGGIQPIAFNVDVSGVLELRIDFRNGAVVDGWSHDYISAVADLGLWT